MPAAAGKLLDGLGQGPEARSFAALGEAGRLKPGTRHPAAGRRVSALRGAGGGGRA